MKTYMKRQLPVQKRTGLSALMRHVHLTVKYNAQLSTGRVQTPTLAMIAEREKQINEFKPKAYYGLQAITEKATFTWRDQSGQTRSFDKAAIEQRLAKLDSVHTGTVTEVKTSTEITTGTAFI